jgi:hypothetical protein
MAILDVNKLPPGLLTTIEQTVWPSIKEKLNPIVWAWFDSNKNDKVTKIFGIYTVTVGSFGIVEFAIKEIFGDENATPGTG